jgi:competence protein ComEC
MSASAKFVVCDLAQAPLVPAALAFTAGIVADRWLLVPFTFSVPLALAALLAWTVILPRHSSAALVPLWLCILALGAAFHHALVHTRSDDDVSHLATNAGRTLSLEGELASTPRFLSADEDDSERDNAYRGMTRGLLKVHRLVAVDGWARDASGLVQFTVPARLREQVHAGDRVRVLGRLHAIEPPGNPGEFDYAAFLRDQGIAGILRASDHEEAIVLLERTWRRTPGGWLSALRTWGVQTLEKEMPRQAPLAQALLLGEGSSLGRRGWDKYLRTGVIHVLAISGQHLVVLASFLWFVLRRPWWSRRTTALLIAALLVGYACLTGGRPPVMRAAWLVFLAAAGTVLRRPTLAPNTLAAAWLGVTLFNPANIFDTGCQLSFLAVAVLLWGMPTPQPDEVKRLEAEQRSLPATVVVTALRGAGWLYLMNATVWLAVAPLILARSHLVSPIALGISPPLVLLTSASLIFGFLCLIIAPLGLGLSMPLAWLTETMLTWSEAIVDWGAALPGAYAYLADVPGWWLTAFYFALAAWLFLPQVGRWRGLMAALGAAWLALGLAFALGWLRHCEDRCTFVAVGHGGCVVLETRSGHVALYDVGSKQGAAVTARQVAPFLWSRGICKLDEVILSHADADHISGLPELVERFSVKRIVHTPSLNERRTWPVHRLLRAIDCAGIPVRIVRRGEHWRLGSSLTFTALHPAEEGPEGKENERSLVLHVRLGEMKLLLTGDLEGAGIPMVLSQVAPEVDVMQAPHHGSLSARPEQLAAWATPRLVISCQALPPGKLPNSEPYDRLGIRFLTTAQSGAVTLWPSEKGLRVAEYRKH